MPNVFLLLFLSDQNEPPFNITGEIEVATRKNLIRRWFFSLNLAFGILNSWAQLSLGGVGAAFFMLRIHIFVNPTANVRTILTGPIARCRKMEQNRGPPSDFQKLGRSQGPKFVEGVTKKISCV